MATEERTEGPDEATPTDVAAQEGPTPTVGPIAALPFQSFHYTVDHALVTSTPSGVTTSGGQIEGDFVAPDSHAFTCVFFEGSEQVPTEDVVIIGAEAWIRVEGSAIWESTTREALFDQGTIDLSSADPEKLFGTMRAITLVLLGSESAPVDGEPDFINGVNARRYDLPQDVAMLLVGALPPDEVDVTIWLEETSGGLVRAEIERLAEFSAPPFPADLPAGGRQQGSITINLTEINSADIEIEPPI